MIETKIYETLQKPFLMPETVIHACDTLSKRILQGGYDEVIEMAKLQNLIQDEQIKEVSQWLSKEALQHKIETELGEDIRKAYPLGVLFHICAGNMEGLSVYSILEGLLTGNINLVKLPSNDTGISSMILEELIRIEPLLEEYIYLFRFSSKNKEKMAEIAALADALIVWGSDEAIQSIRRIVQPNQKIIEWGHKISFAYITMDGAKDEKLVELARHIAKTKQTLCSSCQGIYLNSADKEEIRAFCRRFLSILEQEGKQQPDWDIGWIAQNTLHCYTYQLEHSGDMEKKVEIFKGEGANLFYLEYSGLESSFQGGSIWVKSLLEQDIIITLKKHHGHLQTAGLLSSEEEKDRLTELLIKSGVTRVSEAGNMSEVYPGDSHDGEYPLRRYCKILAF